MFEIGDKVKWIDPGIMDYDELERAMAAAREFEIYDIKGEIICISDGVTEAEVYEVELMPVL